MARIRPHNPPWAPPLSGWGHAFRAPRLVSGLRSPPQGQIPVGARAFPAPSSLASSWLNEAQGWAVRGGPEA